MGEDVHVLRFLTGKYKGDEFPLLPSDAGYVVGRSSEVDLVLADDAVSRKHARFYFERGRVWLRDLGSRNGTDVNGQRVRRHCLRSGDRIVLGSSLVNVALVKAEAAANLKRAGERSRVRIPQDDSGSRSMSGSLEDIPLVDVLQWLGTSRKTGTLIVRRTDIARVGRIYMRDGYAFYASIDGVTGLDPEKAMMRMMAWTKGSFALDNAVIEEVPKEIATTLEHVLMESARQEDEILHLAERSPVPAYGAELRLITPAPQRWRELTPLELDMVQDIAEERNWAHILDTYPADDLTLTRTIVELRRRGLVGYE
jgi:pSer/pThr/pTyr-binding forkhead associated (FHA) protein